MTCYLTSRDDRFAAAVAGGVVSDLVSMAGTSDVGPLPRRSSSSAAAVGERATATRRCRRSHVSTHVATPTLIYHGAADLRCPVGQAQQWHTALRERGVPTRLVLYPEASHLFVLDGRPSHRIDFNRRVVDWVEQYAGAAHGRDAHRRRALAAAPRRAGRSATACPARRSGSCACGPVARTSSSRPRTGVLNKETGVEATTDSVFQIGSITKVWTATVAMQLVDEGKLDLDAPVVDVLPELQLADADVTQQVTMRHLLTHTSGIDGDVFTDTGRGDDCLEKYAARSREAAQNHPLGATWSYCNSGFSLAGRVIEKLTGQAPGTPRSSERLFEPLGLSTPARCRRRRCCTAPRSAMSTSAGERAVRAPPAWGLPRSLGPAGLINATVGDVLAFARCTSTGGSPRTARACSARESTAAMTAKQAELPDKYILGDSWGLGWIRFGWDGRRLIGHDGNTIGQAAFLRVLPDDGLAVTLLTNGGNTPRPLRGPLPRDLRRARRRRDATPAGAARGAGDRRHRRHTSARTSGRAFGSMCSNGDGGRSCAPRSPGRWPPWFPKPVHEYPMTAVEEGPLRRQGSRCARPGPR